VIDDTGNRLLSRRVADDETELLKLLRPEHRTGTRPHHAPTHHQIPTRPTT